MRESGSMARSMGRVAVGSMVANVCAYFVHLPASALLSTDSYGEFAVLLQATLVLGVPALALQAVTAREVVNGRPVASMVRLGVLTAAAVAVIAAVAVWPMTRLAHTGTTATAAAFAVAPLLVLIAVGQGILQGHQRFRRLAWVIGIVGVARTLPPFVVLIAGGGSADALIATMLGAVVAAAFVGWQARVPDRGQSPAHVLTRLSPLAVLQASQVQLVLVSATSVDLLLARSVLGENASGVYALGTVAAKVAFWLPQAVGLVVFPRLADAERSAAALRSALGVLVALSAVTTLGALIGGPLVPMIVGDDYRPVSGLLWIFAVTGGALAILQVALLTAIARRRTRVALLPWTVVVVEVIVIVVFARSVLGLALIAAGGAVVAAAVTVAAVIRR